MERDEIHARIAAIRVELEEKVAELNALIAELGGDDQGDGERRRFTIIRGGLGAVALPTAVLARRPRHPVGVGIAASVVGALAVVLVVPAHTTPGGVGGAISYLSIPAAAPPALAVGSPVSSSAPAPTAPAAASRPATAPRGSASASAPSATGAAPEPSQAPTPAPSSPAPSSPQPSATTTTQPKPTRSASPMPTSSPSCLVNLDAASILRVCVKL